MTDDAVRRAHLTSLHFWATVAIVFFVVAVFRHRDYADKSLDFQTILRLFAWGLALAYCVLLPRTSLSVLLSYTLLPWTIFHAYAVLNIADAENWTFGLTAAISLFIFYVHTAVIGRAFGLSFLIEAILAAMTVVAGVSLVLYFVAPEFARMHEWVGDVRLPSNRLSGIGGSANGLGMTCAMSLTLLVLYWREIGFPRFAKVLIGLLLIANLVLSINRISILAALVCIGLYLVVVKRSLLVLVGAVFVAGTAAILYLGLGDDFLVLLSRSGDVSEIKTGTGRAEIWLAVIDLWKERAVWGWGQGAAISILPYHSNLFTAAAHPHNLFLEVLFSRGLVGLAIFITGIAVALTLALRSRNHRAIILFVFFLVAGFTESIAISGRAGLAIIVLSIAVLEMSGVLGPVNRSVRGTFQTRSGPPVPAGVQPA